jgi:protease I
MARIGFIVDEMFEDSELRVPLDRARLAGHDVVVIGVQGGKQLTGKQGLEVVRTDVGIEDVAADELDALVIPGGYSPDHLRTNEEVVDLVREMLGDEKPVAAICHAGSLLVEADVCEGRTVTSWPSIKTDLVNAGARWVNREVVEDGNLITSRKPADLEAFTDALLRQVERGPRTDDSDDEDDYDGLGLAR